MGLAGDWIFLVFVVLCGSCKAQECRNSPLWLFANPDDIRSIFDDIQDTIVLVRDGVPLEVLTNPSFALQAVFLFETVDEIPLIWCLQDTPEFQEIQYSIEVLSANTEAVEHPRVTVPLQGTITNIPYRFRLLFRCLPSDSISTTSMSIALNSSTSSTGEEFCPIKFYFSKRCSSGEGSADELPTGLEVLGITDGFINDTNFEIKATNPPPITVITNIHNQVIHKVLTGVLVPLCAIILVVIVVVTMVWMVWYRRSNRKILEFHPEAVGLAYQQIYILRKNIGEHEKEFPPSQLKIVRALGEGAFGVVSQGQAEGIINGGEAVTDVAVKQLHSGSSEVEDFFKEVNFMSGLDHPNIVELLGVCSLQEPFSMIFEYMDLGDLRSFLRDAIGLGKNLDDDEDDEDDDESGDKSSDPLLTNKELLILIDHVAAGMSYISGKHLVHRDLAARNCLVATGLVVKIADFGMSRNIDTTDYYKVKGSAMLPVRWMPPESILYGKFTVESDIWAYGILIWEVFTFGQQPYFGLDNNEVILRIKEGKHLHPPPDCPAHQLMLQCWNKNPKKRPSFEESKKLIKQLLKSQDD